MSGAMVYWMGVVGLCVGYLLVVHAEVFVDSLAEMFEALVDMFKILFTNAREGFRVLANVFRPKRKPALSAQERLDALPFKHELSEPKPKELGDNDWNEDHIRLFHTKYMDTPTLIEWIQRQLETKEETRERHLMLDPMYRLDKMMFQLKEKAAKEKVWRSSQEPRVLKGRDNLRPSLRSQYPDEVIEIYVDSQVAPIQTIRKDVTEFTVWDRSEPIRMLRRNGIITDSEARRLTEETLRKDPCGRYIDSSETLNHIFPSVADFGIVTKELK